MDYNKKDLIEIGGSKYMVMSVINKNDLKYLFTNEISTEDEPLNNFFIFYQNKNGNIEALSDANIVNELIPEFQKDLKKTIAEELGS